MPGRMTDEDWQAQKAYAEEADAERSRELAREEGLERLKAAVEAERAKLPPKDREALTRADAARDAYARVREEGRTAPEDVAGRPSGPPMTPNWTPGVIPPVKPAIDVPIPVKDITLTRADGSEVNLGDGTASFHAETTEEREGLEVFPGVSDMLKEIKGYTMKDAEPEPTKALQKWADVAMWQAPKHDDPQKPKVFVTWAPEDPLGLMAMINGMYVGKVYRSPSEVSDDARRQAWSDFAASRLSEAPAEWFQLSILFENVTRAFTHQLVRTRMSTYAQESMRFAVKEDAHDAVKLPPSLAGTVPDAEFVQQMHDQGLMAGQNRTKEQRWRMWWDAAVDAISENYEAMVEDGMPAEDARGILPTNILTRIHDRIDIKTLRNLAGMRLCTQAQFEWRAVFAQLVQALREYLPEDHPNRWQYELIAEGFRPVCFMANKCTMKAKADRHCSIRDQVDIFEANGIKSDRWENWQLGGLVGGRPIRPEQWLADPTAARVAP